MSLFTDIDNYDAGADSAVLMTIHSAKGLEFPVVFLPGWEEGVFPSGAVLYNPEEVEEERRLAYVAITRAREELYLYHAESRMIFGTTNRNRLSRFAEEIPSELLERSQSRTWSRPVPTGAARPSVPTAAAKPQPLYKPHPVKPTPAGTYRAGDTVKHKTFGQGWCFPPHLWPTTRCWRLPLRRWARKAVRQFRQVGEAVIRARAGATRCLGL